MFRKSLVLILMISFIFGGVILGLSKDAYAQASGGNPFESMDKARDESMKAAKVKVDGRTSVKEKSAVDKKKQQEKELL